MVGMTKCFIMLEFHKIMLMEHQKDILEIWILKKIQMAKHGKKDSILRLLILKPRELLMQELLNIKLILLLIEQLTTRKDILHHMLIYLKANPENGIKICYGMQDL